MKRALIVLAIGTLCHATCFGQSRDSLNVNLAIEYQFQACSRTDSITIHMLIPNDIPDRQKINATTVSARPDSVYFIGNNKYIAFTLTAPTPEKLQIIANITIWNGGFEAMTKAYGKKRAFSPSTDKTRYTRPEKYIDSRHPDIIARAEKLQKTKQAATVRNIYYFTFYNIRYAGYLPQPIGSVEALHKKTGDCTEYAHLMTALCRASGIPARSVYGLTCNYTNTPKHEWVEVYLDDIGWVAFDPTPNNFSDGYRTANRYICLCPDGNDPIMQKYRSYYYYRYYGLQPLVDCTYHIW